MNKIMLVVFLLLCACHNPPKEPTKEQLTIARTNPNKELFEIGNRAVIIMRVYNSHGLGNYLTFTNSETKNSYDFYIKNNNADAVYMLPPGTYELSNFYLYEKVTHGDYTKTSKLDLSNLIPAKFSVEAGEIVYLGDILIRLNSGKKIYNNWFTGTSKTQTEVGVYVKDNLNSIDTTKMNYINKNVDNKNIKTRLIEIKK